MVDVHTQDFGIPFFEAQEHLCYCLCCVRLYINRTRAARDVFSSLYLSLSLSMFLLLSVALYDIVEPRMCV